MISGVSVAAEVDHPDVIAAVREEEAEAGVAVPHDDVGGGGLVTVEVEDHGGPGDTRGDPEGHEYMRQTQVQDMFWGKMLYII